MRNVIFTFAIVVVAAVSAANPSPISDEELKKIPKEQIDKTEAHKQELMAQQLNSLTSAVADVKASSQNLKDYAGKVGDLAKHDATVTAQLNTAEKSLWWYRLHWWGAWIALGSGVIACFIVAFLKFTGRLSIAAASVAAKI